MTLTLRPDIEEWIQREIQAGHYSTPEAVSEAALADRMSGMMDETLDADDWVAINEADAELDRGEGINIDEYRGRTVMNNDVVPKPGEFT